MKRVVNLELGKRYIDRDGWISPPIERNTDVGKELYPWKVGRMTYTSSGRFSRERETPRDFIAEYNGVFKHSGNSAADFLDELSTMLHAYGASICMGFHQNISIEVESVYDKTGLIVTQPSVSLSLGKNKELNGFEASDLAAKWRRAEHDPFISEEFNRDIISLIDEEPDAESE